MAARKFLSGIDLASQQIKHVADGSASDDVATWGQVQALVQGLQWKTAARVASTANITISSPGTTIDSATLSNGDRVLLKNQTTASENGIYVYATSSTSMTRATDMDTAAEFPGAAVYVEEGTANADTAWTVTTNAPVTVGTTSIAFAQFGSGGATYTADSVGGLQLVSTAFSVKLPASSGLIKDSTGLYIDKSIAMTRYAADIGDGATTSIVVTHNLGTRDVMVTLYDKGTNAEVDTDVVHTSTTTITLNFASAPSTNGIRVVVIG